MDPDVAVIRSNGDEVTQRFQLHNAVGARSFQDTNHPSREFTMQEHVIIVDEENTPLGTRPKSEVHGAETTLHRGFSVFVFDHDGRFLIQQRSAEKQTWPLVWSNSCCGHPQIDETPEAAVERRLSQELGLSKCELHEIIPGYRYQAVYDGVMENEFCPVWVTWSSSEPQFNEAEVAQVRWISWQEFIDEITNDGDHAYAEFSCWSLEEAVLLNQSPQFQDLWKTHVG